MAAERMTANMGDAECPICAEPFTEPRQLPCGHVYCVECLDKWMNLGDGQWPRLTCPTCREQFQLPDGGGGVVDLPLPDFDEDAADDDVDLSSFELVVADLWPDERTSDDDEPQPADIQDDDNSWIDHNVNEVDVINRNVDAVPDTSDDDLPTGGPLDNDVVLNAPAGLDENEQGARRFVIVSFQLACYFNERSFIIHLIESYLTSELN